MSNRSVHSFEQRPNRSLGPIVGKFTNRKEIKRDAYSSISQQPAQLPNLYSAHEYLVFMAAYMAAQRHIVQKNAKIPSINGENAMYSYVLPIGYFMSYCM